MKNYPSIHAYFSYIRHFKAAFWLTAAAYAVADAILAIIPWLIGGFTTSLTQPGGHIVAWTAALIAASIGHDMFWRTGDILYYKLLLTPSQRIDDVIFSAVISHNYGYFVDKFTGKISSYATSLGRDFRELLATFHNEHIGILVTLPIIAATMFTVSLYTGLIFIISLLLMYGVGRKLALLAAAAAGREADERSTMDGYVVDAIANFVSVKAFRNEQRENSRLYDKRQALIKAANEAMVKDIWFWAGMSLFVRWIIWPSTFILNVYLYVHGQLSLSQMTTFLAAIVLFSNFIWEVIWGFSKLNLKIAGVEQAYRYLFGDHNIFADTPPTPAKPLTPAAFKHALELKNVTFAYPDQPEAPVLNNINITIKHGEKIGVVGPSGGGKSTLLKLLLGYYPIEQGQLLLDGRPINTYELTSLIAYVPQDTAVFHRPIRENIAYARPEAAETEIQAAAQHAQAHAFIQELPDGYDTYVGERGVKLSGGQRQRIAIARAILKDAPLLMLDEATSALDSESEKLIQKALLDLLEHRTAVVIAHRLSTIQHLDRIIVFDKGVVAEEGTHAELLQHGGLYAKLWSHQSGGFINENLSESAPSTQLA